VGLFLAAADLDFSKSTNLYGLIKGIEPFAKPLIFKGFITLV
jgi:hypothetical protein